MGAKYPFPEIELDAYRCITGNQLNLRHFVEAFQQSVGLFEFLERGGGPPSVGVFGGIFPIWRMFAARHGALQIFHFKCTLDSIRSQLYRCPTIAKKTDINVLRNASKLFDSYFPHAEAIRHAVAHAGELFETPEKTKKHQGNLSSLGGNSVYERTYKIQFEGQMFMLEMTDASIQKLIRVATLANSAFPSLDELNAPMPEN